MECYCNRNTDQSTGFKFKNWKRLHAYAIIIAICFCFGFCLCIYGICTATSSECRNMLVLKDDNNHFQKSLENKIGKVVHKMSTTSIVGKRRLLGGLGSSPPRCTSKCGRCTPCKPVHVTVPPGTPVTTEYYPEAWRCKCGNKLYMP